MSFRSIVSFFLPFAYHIASGQVTIPGENFGATPGSFAVSDAGAATYSIPLRTPPGTAGLQPRLSLQYNSLGGNGPLGLGWSLQGISAITRIGRTRAQDETTTSANQTKAVALDVSYTRNDRYALDGNRLVLAPESILANQRLDANYGNDQTVYYSEQQTFTKVVLYTNPANGAPHYFKAYTKSGLIIEYGNTDNARVLDPVKQAGVQWLVNRIEDRKGNYMTFSYLRDAVTGENYPETIEYTGNNTASLLPYNKVTFLYETRPDAATLYGLRFQQKNSLTRRLKSVQVFGQNTLIRQYNLGYTVNRYSQLTSVTECDGSGNCFKPTVFEWQSTVGTPGIARALSFNPGRLMGDFNGDGLLDAVDYYSIPVIRGVNRWDVTTIYQFTINDGNGNFVFAGEIRSPAGREMSDAAFSDFSNRKPVVAELNGDNVDDIVLNWANLVTVPGVPEPFNTGFEFILSKNVPGNPYAWSYSYSQSGAYGANLPIFSDVSGDAISDQTFISYPSGVPTIGNSLIVSDIPGDKRAEYYPLGQYSSISGYNAGLSYANPNQHIVDLTGDGLSELFIYDKNTGNNLTIFTGSVLVDSSVTERRNNYRVGYRRFVRNSILPADIIGSPATTLFFDANADKVADLVYYLPSSNLIRIFPGRGDGTFADVITINPVIGSTAILTDFPTILQLDHDADGYMDLVFFEKTNGNNRLFLNQGNFSFVPATQAVNVYPPAMFKEGNWYKIGPFLRGSVADVLYFDKAQGKSYILPLGQKSSILLNRITTGTQQTTAIVYDNLLNQNFHKRAGNIQYPVIDFQAALNAVSRVKVTSPDGYTYATAYRYEGATLNIEGRGFRGFSKIIETDTISGIYSIRTYRQDLNSWRYGGNSLLKTERFFKDGGLLSYSENTAALIPYPTDTPADKLNRAKSFLAYYSSQKTIDYVTGKTRLFRQQLDAFGSPVYSVTDYANGSRDSTRVTYQNDTGRWLLGLPTLTSQFYFAAGQTAISRQSSAEYEATTGLLTRKTAFPNLTDQQKQTTAYTYDAFGNIIQEDLTAWNGIQTETRTNKVSFETTGRFPLTRTNPLNQVSTSTYNTALGVRLTETDANNLTVRFDYDGFGRITRQTAPDNTWTVTAYRSAHPTYFNSPAGAVFLTYTQTSEGKITQEHFDAHGRSVQSKSKAFDGRFSVVQRTYQRAGGKEQVKETYPYFEGQTPGGYTLSENDLLGRLSRQQETKPGGLRTATITYAGQLTTTTNYLGQTKTEVRDSKDQLVEARRNDGHNVFYGYNPAGEQVASRDLRNNTIVHDYDARGLETAMSDPDMGLYLYAYNGFGELISQTYPGGEVVRMEYDKLGRLVKQTQKEGVTTRLYDTGNKAVGKLVNVNGYTSQSSFSFDNLGRPSQEIQVIDGQSYTTGYSYDASGRLQTLTYPTGLQLRHTYNGSGYLSQLSNGSNNALFWRQDSTDANGQVTRQQFGNNVITTRQFNPSSNTLSGIKSTYNTTVLQQFSYQYNDLDHVTERADIKRNKREVFAYDAVNRLASSQVIGAAAIQLSYDEIGNITSKSDVGRYFYGPAGNGPHRLQTVASNETNLSCSIALNIGTEYSSFNKISRMSNDTSYALISYDADYQRVLQKLYIRNSLNRTKRYVGRLMEVETYADGRTRTMLFLKGIGLWIDEKPAGGAATSQVKYPLKDHLGSITGYTGANGAVLEELSFDAWGKRRNADWSPATATYKGFERGFTEHEHYDLFSLIDMNGRVYDPVLARFLSPDPVVQDQTDLQAFNRYSYVMNNPLNATDPSGYFLSPIQQIPSGYLNYGYQSKSSESQSQQQTQQSYNIVPSTWALPNAVIAPILLRESLTTGFGSSDQSEFRKNSGYSDVTEDARLDLSSRTEGTFRAFDQFISEMLDRVDSYSYENALYNDRSPASILRDPGFVSDNSLMSRTNYYFQSNDNKKSAFSNTNGLTNAILEDLNYKGWGTTLTGSIGKLLSWNERVSQIQNQQYKELTKGIVIDVATTWLPVGKVVKFSAGVLLNHEAANLKIPESPNYGPDIINMLPGFKRFLDAIKPGL